MVSGGLAGLASLRSLTLDFGGNALLAGLETWLEESGLDPVTTYFWICDFCIRQLEGKMEDVRRLGAVVQCMEMTVMFLEPWDKMVATFEGEILNCLSRIW